MTKTIAPVSFFLGANNRREYASLFNELYDPKAEGAHYILKGGPGTGKSTLMKKIADKFEKEGYFVERGYCSADPNSLDAVIVPERSFSIIDGTSPHTFDPTYPGVTEILINLGDAWDRDYLKEHRKAICSLTDENKALHKKASEFMLIASQMKLESMRLCSEITDRKKLENYAFRLCSREIPRRSNAKQGKIQKRFLSGITPDGVVLQYDTIVALSEKIITIEDEYSLAAPFIMNYIMEYAVSNGYDIYACFCPLFPTAKVEHVIIPELKLCFFTENFSHASLIHEEKITHATRFLNKAELSKIKNKIDFNNKTEREMISEAVKKISVAKGVHDRLEDYYIRATDFSVIEDIGEKLFKEIF